MIPALAHAVSRVTPDSIEIEDLEQIGHAALWIACERYDVSRAATFRNYCRLRIKGAMIDAVRGREFREASRERDAVRIDSKVVAINELRTKAMPTFEPGLDRAIAVLPARQAQVIQMRYREDLSQEETAARLGISRTSVCRDEQTALAAMRTRLVKAA
jgi:RNA polymerase sigma factor (sigma-70 family)